MLVVNALFEPILQCLHIHCNLLSCNFQLQLQLADIYFFSNLSPIMIHIYSILVAEYYVLLLNIMFQKYVDYYQVIHEPIDLRMIAQKIQSQSYETLDSMHKDLMLMIQNAKYFNKPSSLIYKV